MVITFIGHGSGIDSKKVKTALLQAIEPYLHEKIDFYLGGYGDFDVLCASVLKENRPENCKLIFVTPYILESYQHRLKHINSLKIYDEIVYPSIENVPYKFAISKRNEYMIDCADLVIAYIDHTWGGAYNTYLYALRKGKMIINLYNFPS